MGKTYKNKPEDFGKKKRIDKKRKSSEKREHKRVNVDFTFGQEDDVFKEDDHLDLTLDEEDELNNKYDR